MSKHTETPWSHNGLDGRDRFWERAYAIYATGDVFIGSANAPKDFLKDKEVDEDTKDANIRFIVRAVNSHGDLLSIVKDILPDDHSDYSDGERCDECGTRRESSDQTECNVPGCWYVRVREAIAKATGK